MKVGQIEYDIVEPMIAIARELDRIKLILATTASDWSESAKIGRAIDEIVSNLKKLDSAIDVVLQIEMYSLPKDRPFISTGENE